MQRIFNWYRDNAGNAISGATVTVYQAGTLTPATIYESDSNDTPVSAKPNPFTTDANGYWCFAAPVGDYDIKIEGAGNSNVFVQRVNLFDSTASVGASTPDATGVTYTHSGTGATTGTVYSRLEDLMVSVKAFGAAGDGTTDDTTAINRVLTFMTSTGGICYFPKGVYKITSQLTVPDRVQIWGDGYSENHGTGSNYAASAILKSFNGTGMQVNDDCVVFNIGLRGDTGNTGDGIQIYGGRVTLRQVSVCDMGGVGIRIGADNTLGINCNAWRLDQVISIYNGSHGLYINHTNSNTSGSYPQGQPDVNAGTATGLDLRANTGDGLRISNAIDNKFYGVVSQANGGNGVKLLTDARGHQIYGLYTEANATADMTIDAGATDNLFIGNRAIVGSSTWVDNGSRNYLFQRATSRYGNGGWSAGPYVTIANGASGGVGSLSFYSDTGYGNTANVTSKQTVGSGGNLVIQTKRNGNTPVDRLTIDEVGTATFSDLVVIDGSANKNLKYTNGVANGAVATTFGGVGPVGANAGNQLGWLRINVAGTDRYVPYW